MDVDLSRHDFDQWPTSLRIRDVTSEGGKSRIGKRQVGDGVKPSVRLTPSIEKLLGGIDLAFDSGDQFKDGHDR